MALLRFHPVRQTLPRPRLDDPAATLRDALARCPGPDALQSGARVAVAVGSRNIARLPELARTLVEALRDAGHAPFLVPAMGSHGNGFGEGQRAVLASLGVTENTVGAELVCGDELALAGRTQSGIPLWVDRAAWEADAVVPLNRVKPHTAFRGPVESGPAKMLAVGLGKQKSAEIMHRHDLDRAIPEAAARLFDTGKIPFGVALVENGWGEIATLEALTPPRWLDKEARMLKEAWVLYPKLPWQELDLLIVEQMGKDVSGSGMDMNVIGLERRYPGCGATPKVGRLIVLSLTPGSRGNATGMGYADLVTRALADAVNEEATRTNCETAGFPEAARLPAVAPDEEAAVRKALEVLGLTPDACRAVRIRDTAHLTELEVTAPLLNDLPTGVYRS